jgi:hypothetical protein
MVFAWPGRVKQSPSFMQWCWSLSTLQLGRDLDDLSTPLQAAGLNGQFHCWCSYTPDTSCSNLKENERIGAIAAVTVVGLILAGALGSSLGDAHMARAQ